MKKKDFVQKNRLYIFFVVFVVTVTFTAAMAYAASVPNTFTSGGTISSSEMNANFDYLEGRCWEKSSGDLYYNTGNVGIGTTIPYSDLQLRNRMTLQGVINTQSLYGNNVYHDGTVWKYIEDAQGAAVRMGFLGGGDITFHTLPSGIAGDPILDMDTTGIKMAITNNGNVGIGTTTPYSTLDVQGASVGDALHVTSSAGGGDAAVRATATGTGTYGVVGTSDNYIAASFNSSSGTALEASTSSGYAAIFSGGNVGIGTTSPAETLDVNGNVNANGTVTATNFNYSAAKTKYLMLAGSQCTGRNLDILNGGSPFFCELSTTTADTDAYWSVNLPYGAIVTGFQVYVYSFSDTTTCKLRRGNNNVGSEMASVTRINLSWGWTAEDTTISFNPVATDQYAYAVNCTRTGITGQSVIGAIRIKYTTTEPN